MRGNVCLRSGSRVSKDGFYISERLKEKSRTVGDMYKLYEIIISAFINKVFLACSHTRPGTYFFLYSCFLRPNGKCLLTPDFKN